MKYLKLPLLLCAGILFSCSRNKPQADPVTPDTPSLEKTTVQHAPVKVNTDTLQFIQFDANGVYWDAYFLNAKKDTIRLVTDKEFKEKMLNTLMRVEWKTDTLFSAGEGEAKYADKRLVGFSQIKGTLFSKPLTDKEVIRIIKELPEVKGSADNVYVNSSPTFDKPYFDVGTSTQGEDVSSMYLSFRIYTFPQYKINVFDSFSGGEIGIEEWRKNNN